MINQLNITLLQAASGGGIQQIIFLVGIVLVFYFFMIRPQMKKQKEAKKFVEGIKKGDKVITIGGAHGKIVEMADTTITLEVESGAKIKFLKSAISADNTASLNNQQA